MREATRASGRTEVEGLHSQGVMFYPGHIRMPLAEQGPALAEVSRRLGTFLEALGAAGLTPGVVSGGSTPTPWRSHEVVGMNEIHPGITPFFDRASLCCVRLGEPPGRTVGGAGNAGVGPLGSGGAGSGVGVTSWVDSR
ncbi:MAG TPA: hypothetical protein VK458_02555 [Myxococcaceae bacterium]|nr:hypothetical protein [Myxococcaceae bacterium]